MTDVPPAYVTRQEFEAFKAAMRDEQDGEKTVSRHILRETRQNSDDLATIKTRLDRVEDKVDALDSKVAALDRKVDSIDQGLKSLGRSMPGIVADAMREIERERRERGGA